MQKLAALRIADVHWLCTHIPCMSHHGLPTLLLLLSPLFPRVARGKRQQRCSSTPCVPAASGSAPPSSSAAATAAAAAAARSCSSSSAPTAAAQQYAAASCCCCWGSACRCSPNGPTPHRWRCGSSPHAACQAPTPSPTAWGNARAPWWCHPPSALRACCTSRACRTPHGACSASRGSDGWRCGSSGGGSSSSSSRR